MKLGLLLLTLTILATSTQPAEQHVQSVTVKYQNTFDTRGIQFFELRRGAEVALVSVPDNSELAKFLQSNDGRKLILTLERP